MIKYVLLIINEGGYSWNAVALNNVFIPIPDIQYIVFSSHHQAYVLFLKTFLICLSKYICMNCKNN